MDQHWWSTPEPLLDLPPSLAALSGSKRAAPLWRGEAAAGCSVTASSQRPAPLAVATAPTRPRRRPEEAGESLISLFEDRAALFGSPVGRCLCRLEDGTSVVVPHLISSLGRQAESEEDAELLAAELIAPSGGPGWIDSRDAAFVVHGASPATSELFLLTALRRLVQRHVVNFSNLQPLSRGTYALVAPAPRSQLRVTLVPVAELRTEDAALRAPADAPPKTAGRRPPR
jgi:hypothetical protein